MECGVRQVETMVSQQDGEITVRCNAPNGGGRGRGRAGGGDATTTIAGGGGEERSGSGGSEEQGKKREEREMQRESDPPLCIYAVAIPSCSPIFCAMSWACRRQCASACLANCATTDGKRLR